VEIRWSGWGQGGRKEHITDELERKEKEKTKTKAAETENRRAAEAQDKLLRLYGSWVTSVPSPSLPSPQPVFAV
jgi:hypothetical protein